MVKGLDRWPLWGEPATKGEVVTAMVATRSCIVDIYIALRALSRNDMVSFNKSLDDLHKNDEDLQKLLDRIGGKPDSD